MLHLICGDSGAGKTALCTDLVKAALKDGKKVFYIVPEQQTVSVESAMARVLAPLPCFHLKSPISPALPTLCSVW